MSRKFNGDYRSKQGLLQVFSKAKYSTFTKKTPGGRSSLPPNLSRYFSLVELKLATNNFNDDLIIGKGRFGIVYKGSIIDNGLTRPVAIKRLSDHKFFSSVQGAHEFKAELLVMSQLCHENLVSLIGYCDDDKEVILVYDHMARGTLRDHLHRRDDHHNPPLLWKQRLKICIEAARGLHYLHTGVKHMIIHRNVTTENIQLDDGWVAKVNDFELSKMGPNTMPNSKSRLRKINTSRVVGTYGYLAPEYAVHGELTEKTDVYAFGVVLCEVLCARRSLIRSPIRPLDNITLEDKSIEEYYRTESLSYEVRKCYNEGTLDKVIDPSLKGIIAPDCLTEFVRLALICTSEDESDRMYMNEVELSLELALELQESWEKKKTHDLNLKMMK